MYPNILSIVNISNETINNNIKIIKDNVSDVLKKKYNQTEFKRFFYIDYITNKILFDKKSIKVLIVGTGDSILEHFLINNKKIIEIISIDNCCFTNRFDVNNKVEYIKMDLFELPNKFNNNFFDIVICSEVLEHIDLNKYEKAKNIIENLGENIIITIPFNEKRPLYAEDKPWGHKQSFDEKKIDLQYKNYKKLLYNHWIFLIK